MATKKKTAKKVPAKKAARKNAKRVNVRVRNPNFGKNKGKKEVEENAAMKAVPDDTCAAQEREPTEYERGVEQGKREERKNSIQGDINQLEGLQSALAAKLETHSMQHSNYLFHKSKLLETESEIIRIRGNISRLQARVRDRAGIAMTQQ